MGAESSQMKNVSISEKQLAEKLRNDLLLYDARLNNSKQKVSVFEDSFSSKDNPFKEYTLDRPLSKAIKNLKIYRHPYSILKFLGSSSDKMLVTEFVIGSLEKNLKKQSEIQICLGLKNILNALIFLVESAKVRHLNVSLESIFVTENGTWKLNGMEHVFKSSDISKELLQRSRSFRNHQAHSADEDDGTGLEQFAFATLCENLINKDSNIPFVQDFLTYCQTHLKHKNPSMRPLLSAIQLHNYFTHDFVIIHGFLSELALKTQPAKQEFFKILYEKLKQFDESAIGPLSELLLSRLVLLETSAQFYFLPYLLKPQNLEDDEETSVDDGLFSTPGFVKFIVPKLKQVFCVLDVQIRLILLEHFHLYVNTFTREELIDEILPQLLLGIKDTNDLLVTKTLLCLADLIPILGASQVIGKNRRKLFADGRPQQTEIWNVDQPRSITPVLNASMDIFLSSSPVDNIDISECSTKEPTKILVNGTLPAIINKVTSQETSNENGFENEWSWDQEDGNEDVNSKLETEPVVIIEEISSTTSLTSPIKEKIITRPQVADITELDIKNRRLTKLEEKQNEVDFFSDFNMAPTFQKTEPIVAETNIGILETKNETASRLQMTADTTENDGWDDDDWNSDEIL
ncbi:CLUMA_CG004486, isoform A [Clunio marinus]|uniref:CLUMA_CG004486, isoform A n=1 Tax=Clunio marinus TaxID=568069 RepID=A0A1J1HTU5_9DIPT|nr:CLUMA_CG004486, isoform A [Clunio marinus]